MSLSLQVLVRMNIFVVILCLVMGRPYQFYYFVPLVTFWFLVLYIVLLVYPKVTAGLVKGRSYIVELFWNILIQQCSYVPCSWSQNNFYASFVKHGTHFRVFRYYMSIR